MTPANDAPGAVSVRRLLLSAAVMAGRDALALTPTILAGRLLGMMPLTSALSVARDIVRFLEAVEDEESINGRGRKVR